ncbi:unnamed protein product, partial [Staurois parvus]
FQVLCLAISIHLQDFKNLGGTHHHSSLSVTHSSLESLGFLIIIYLIREILLQFLHLHFLITSLFPLRTHHHSVHQGRTLTSQAHNRDLISPSLTLILLDLVNKQALIHLGHKQALLNLDSTSQGHSQVSIHLVLSPPLIHRVHRLGFNPPGSQPSFNQPNFNQSGPPPGFNQSAAQPPFNPPGINQPSFTQPNPGPQPGFNQPGTSPQPNFPQPVPGPQQGFNNPGFTRERPVRINLPSPGPMGIPPFSQPSTNIRHFPPPRQPFPPVPGQPFMLHSQSNMQGPMQPPLQPLHQHHLSGGQQKPPMPMPPTPSFRAHLQNSQNLPHRMPGPRHPALKQRQGAPVLNMVKTHNQQAAHPRNSNLRELPIAPSHSIDMNKRKATSAPAAHVIPVATTAPQPRSVSAENAQVAKPGNITSTIKAEVKSEEQFPDEDEETRKYRLKIEEQKRLREEILKQKELRRQQQAGARKKELLQRLSSSSSSSKLAVPSKASLRWTNRL